MLQPVTRRMTPTFLQCLLYKSHNINSEEQLAAGVTNGRHHVTKISIYELFVRTIELLVPDQFERGQNRYRFQINQLKSGDTLFICWFGPQIR